MVEPRHPPSRDRSAGRRTDVQSALRHMARAMFQPLNLVIGLVLLLIGRALSIGAPTDRTPFAACDARPDAAPRSVPQAAICSRPLGAARGAQCV